MNEVLQSWPLAVVLVTTIITLAVVGLTIWGGQDDR